MKRFGRLCNMSAHLPKGVVTEGRVVIREWGPGILQAIAVLMGWVALTIGAMERRGVVQNRNELLRVIDELNIANK